MTSLERIRCAARRQPVDRVPVAPYMGNHGARAAGVPIGAYCRSGRVMAEAQFKAWQIYGPDAVVAQSDNYYIAEGFGVEVEHYEDSTPTLKTPALQALADVDRLRVPDPYTDGRMPVYLEAIRRLVEMTHGEVAVRAPGTGPFSLAGHLLGTENFLVELALTDREPGGPGEQSLKRLLELTTDALIAFARACLEAGAHIVQAGDSLASLDMISPAAYRKWAWPAERRFFTALNPSAERCGAATLLHICGNMTAALESMADTGAHILELDHKVSLKAAAERVGNRVCLMGNIDPVELLWRGTPAEVARASRQAIAEAGHCSIILGSGCEVPVAAPKENVMAMIETAKLSWKEISMSMTKRVLAGILMALCTAAGGAEPGFQSPYLAVAMSPSRPAFSFFAVDSLGQGKVHLNPVLVENNAVAVPGLELEGPLKYKLNGSPVWRIVCGEKTVTLRSDFVPGVEVPPLVLAFNQKSNHATLLGLMQPGERRVALPCVLHLPDMGSVRITCDVRDWKLDYDARRWKVLSPFVRVAFPPATSAQPHVEYQLEVAAIYPRLPGIEADARYDGYRRDFLNSFQVNPRVQMLANNASSDPVPFTIFEYAEVARLAPPLADGLTCLDLVRMSMDRYLAGAKGYGQKGYGMEPTDADLVSWPTPWTSLDSLPSLLITACIYSESAGDLNWARANYDQLLAWAREMMAADLDGNGLLEYPGTGNFGDRPLSNRRPSNWWDTINFGHEDAYSNALAYRAATLFANLARRLNRYDDAGLFATKAAKLRAAYMPTFLNPATGVLAGWKSADGQLHDYWFTFVQGVAVTYGLLDDTPANAVMDRLLAKMEAVGYTNFSLGLPGNLVPIKKGDYAIQNSRPEQFGEPQRDDGSDGFQFYENGGATGCYAYFTIKALYQLGRVEDARRILYPMLNGYAAGQFQGFDATGLSRDWRDWRGGGHGYEGLLVDNYLTLLAVLDDLKTPHPAAPVKPSGGRRLGLSQTNGVLVKDGQPYRGVGANYFDLFLRVLHNPTNATSLDGLRRLSQAGLPFVRFAVAYNEQDWRVFFDHPDEFFRDFDLVVKTAEQANVGLIPSFFWSFQSFPDLANEPRDQWGNPDSKTMALMRQAVAAIVERYRNSPALWAWEFGNEPNLGADLPNAAQFRKPGGTERDDLTAKAMVVKLTEFAKEVRRHDTHRLIIAGHSHPRASAWHNTAEKSWKADSKEQTLEILRRDNPGPLDTIAIHVYADQPTSKEMAEWAKDQADYLRVVRGLSRELKRPVIVGEFGLASKPGETDTLARFEQLLADMEQAEMDLAAFWVFDLPSQSQDWSVTFDNARANMLKLTAEANRRWNKAALLRQP